ncbi:MAG: potassium transporter Kup [Acidobacteria bacterium]|nr:potassium transporter Kup [Acidobacteriota bacterium]
MPGEVVPPTLPSRPVSGTRPGPAAGHHLVELSLAALGVVFGDIGTSPLYAIREAFHGEYAIAVTRANVLGVLSLILWSLICVVTIKYLLFILNADNSGEGGVIALTALLSPYKKRGRSAGWVLVPIGLFAAALLYGDGMITPAISVMSAIEGVRVITPAFQPFVVPITAAILIGLFIIQKHGTARVGSMFGPVILLWLVTLGSLGAISIAHNSEILAAVSPLHGIDFLVRNHLHGFIVLGAVFLVVTGAEALYADLGHFGKRPIRLTWLVLVLPMLLLNYFGQGAILLTSPSKAHHPFYALVPAWGMVPMVLLATMATIIASQAVISGAFSLTRQAIQLGYLPRLKIVHTSAKHMGQIYVGPVNWILMICTVGLVFGFRSSSKLAAAYGVAVTSTMLISSVLFYEVARRRWGWSRWAAGVPVAGFLVLDISFFSANISKILHGAWFPLAIGALVFALMVSWKQGRSQLAERMKASAVTFDQFQAMITENPPTRVSGKAVFLTGKPDIVPAALLHNLAHNKILHTEVMILNFATETVPRVPNDRKVEVSKLGGGLFRVVAHYGFMEEFNIPNILSLVREQGLDFRMEDLSFFLGRLRLSVEETSPLGRLQRRIFAFMARNAGEAAGFFGVPSEQVIEVGVDLRL